MERNAGAAVTLAREHFGEELNFTEGSIEAVERCLTRLYDAMPRSFFKKLFRPKWNQERIDRLTMLFGGYIGEVFRRHHGGVWAIEEPPGAGGAVIAIRDARGGIFFPPAKVLKRLTNGPEDDVWYYYRILVDRYLSGTGE